MGARTFLLKNKKCDAKLFTYASQNDIIVYVRLRNLTNPTERT
nr:MAG TPA: hypothetical protein [Caudoviricetes sp.]